MTQPLNPNPVRYNDFVVRPSVWADLPDIVEMLAISTTTTQGQPEFTLEAYTAEWEAPDFDPQRDSRVAVNATGQIVANVDLVSSPPHVRNFLYVTVHPAYWGLGLGSYLTAWGEQAMCARIDDAPADARVSIICNNISTHQSAFAVLQAQGYQYVRSFYHMKTELTSPPPAPVWPAGLLVRPLQPGEEAVLYAADQGAFQDHWGHIATDDKADFHHWWETQQNKPDFDPSLIFLALAGDQLAGYAICFPNEPEFPGMGWIDRLGVRRPWRRQGLGLALLHHCFGEFYRRGIARAGLGVDASSLTGAVRLYERAGMHVFRQLDVYEKELRPGRDLTTQALAATHTP